MDAAPGPRVSRPVAICDNRVMKVIVTGAGGLVGSHVSRELSSRGHTATPLTRPSSRTSPGSIVWDPHAGRLDPAALEGHDAVVHLAGESISSGRWSAERKRRILESRVKGTTLLSETLARVPNGPKVLVSASAIGYYGDRGADRLDENAAPGHDFLAEVCQRWEAATRPAAEAGVRVVRLRFGIILSPDGGALPKLLTPFKLGAGGVIGNGRQYMSWIDINDIVGLIVHALSTPGLDGPVNAVAPSPVTNAVFTKVLGRVLSRPTFFPLPAFAARLLLGEMADALLLSSQNVSPVRATASGYAFRFNDLESSLRHQLENPAR